MSERVLSQPQPPEAPLKRLLIYNAKHTSCSAKQCKITPQARVCVCVPAPGRVCVCVHLAVQRSEAVVGSTLNKTWRMH